MRTNPKRRLPNTHTRDATERRPRTPGRRREVNSSGRATHFNACGEFLERNILKIRAAHHAGREVRLQQQLRFRPGPPTAVGDLPLAGRGRCAAKSCGCLSFRVAPRLVPTLRLFPTAPYLRANLRSLLVGNSFPERSCVLALRRFSPGTGRSAVLYALPGLPPRAAAI
jgi:hypothetical protein